MEHEHAVLRAERVRGPEALPALSWLAVGAVMFCHAGSYTPPTASGASYVYYDKAGGRWEDTGSGTHAASDFHHNGDLENYNDPFCINLGKIYGALDDLRTESPRVQVLLPPLPTSGTRHVLLPLLNAPRKPMLLPPHAPAPCS